MAKLLIVNFFDTTEKKEVLNVRELLDFVNQKVGYTTEAIAIPKSGDADILISSKPFSTRGGYSFNKPLHFSGDVNPSKAFLNVLKKIPPDLPALDILLLGHGCVIGGKHMIEFSIDNGTTNSTLLKTADFFQAISNSLPGTKINMLMVSCFSGMAQCDVNILPEGSILYTTSDPTSVLAAAPLRSAMDKYPEGKPYDHLTFIELMLLNRGSNSPDAAPNLLAHQAPYLIRDRVQKGLSGGEVITYQISDLSKINWRENDLLKMLSREGESYHILLAILQLQGEGFEGQEVRDFIHKYDAELSCLALRTGSSQPHDPSSLLPFVNSYQYVSFVVSCQEMCEIFLHTTPTSKSHLIDFLRVRSHYGISFNGEESEHRKLVSNGLRDLIQGKDTPNFATIWVACDVAPKHHTSESGYVLRVGLIPFKLLNIYYLLEMDISEDVAKGMLDGTVSDIYSFLQKAATAKDGHRIGEAVEEIRKVVSNEDLLTDLGVALSAVYDVALQRTLESEDPLTQKVCGAINKCLAKVAKAHNLAATEYASNDDVVSAYAHYLHNSAPESEISLINMVGEDGEISAAFNVTELS